MPKKNWIEDAIKHKGSLRKSLGIKKGEVIPEKRLKAATKKKGITSKRAILAETLRSLKK